MSAVAVRYAERMLISADLRDDGVAVAYADGQSGVVPYEAIDGIAGRKAIERLELPTPYAIVLVLADGSQDELPWDFVRWHCDESYESRTAATIARGRQSVGARVRHYRQAGELTQTELAGQAGIGRVTLSRIETGEQTARLETLSVIADALGIDVVDLLAGDSG